VPNALQSQASSWLVHSRKPLLDFSIASAHVALLALRATLAIRLASLPESLTSRYGQIAAQGHNFAVQSLAHLAVQSNALMHTLSMYAGPNAMSSWGQLQHKLLFLLVPRGPSYQAEKGRAGT
jgi:hypothetical protein